MLQSFFQHANWLAILVSAIAFFALGSLWFSMLFGKTWQAEVEKHGIKIRDPKGSEIAMKMIQTFVCNLIGALAIAILIYLTGLTGAINGAKLGLLCGAGFAVTAIITSSVWESRPLKLVAIDFGYPLVGLIICGIILTIWK
jgi:uncharacterized membrane protein YkgB